MNTAPNRHIPSQIAEHGHVAPTACVDYEAAQPRTQRPGQKPVRRVILSRRWRQCLKPKRSATKGAETANSVPSAKPTNAASTAAMAIPEVWGDEVRHPCQCESHSHGEVTPDSIGEVARENTAESVGQVESSEDDDGRLQLNALGKPIVHRLRDPWQQAQPPRSPR